jgi:hypothetical protein
LLLNGVLVMSFGHNDIGLFLILGGFLCIIIGAREVQKTVDRVAKGGVGNDNDKRLSRITKQAQLIFTVLPILLLLACLVWYRNDIFFFGSS